MGLFKDKKATEQNRQIDVSNAQKMRDWEEAERAKSLERVEIAKWMNQRGISSDLALRAVQDSVATANMLSFLGVPSHEANKLAFDTKPLSWDEVGGYAPHVKNRGILAQLGKYVPAVVGSAVGTALGGPAGGIIGGSLGGTTARGGKNKLKGAGVGAGIGAAYTAAAPSLAESLGVTGSQGPISHLVSEVSGLNSPSLLNQLGVSSAPSLGGGLGLIGNAGQLGLLDKAKEAVTSLPAVSKAKSLLDNPFVQTALRGATTHLTGRQAQAQSQSQPQHQIAERFEFHPTHGKRIEPNSPYEKGQPSISAIISNPHSSPIEKLLQIIQIIGSEDKSSTHEALKRTSQAEQSQFRRGGYVDGESGGQDDDVPVDLPEGSYVMDATTISLLGDGSSNNGAKKVKQMEDKFLRSGITRDLAPSHRVRTIKAKVSPGEYIVDKSVVDAAGNGNNKKGAKVFDKFRNNIRSHKGVKKFLPPKSKSIDSYIAKSGRR
jgi:hypothetical protein